MCMMIRADLVWAISGSMRSSASPAGDVVHNGSPRLDRRARNFGFRRVDGKRHIDLCSQLFDHRNHTPQLLLKDDRFRAGARRFAADVDDVRAFPRQLQAAFCCFVCVRNSPPSENESGVTFNTPMINPCRETSKTRSPIFQILSCIYT